MPLNHLGFHLHLLIETPAAIGFILAPSSTLSTTQPHAHAALRQYGLLLLATNLIVLATLQLLLLLDDDDDDDSSIFVVVPPAAASVVVLLRRRVAAALALYHVGPCLRALCRLRITPSSSSSSSSGTTTTILAHPLLHLVAHGFCLLALLWDAFCRSC
ncbi:hypothetical protein XA68_18356 [Ophiocordyceps unilateralis]|uniref:Uncharacterized protein n=1 Tax=Ophiocordyceps unilateralis TaxID=268505 RepID=A0A2A9PI31_OPHUN|nr:hypothetical protein XA68_18356 [Ophiocordyceps unilateralis]